MDTFERPFNRTASAPAPTGADALADGTGGAGAERPLVYTQEVVPSAIGAASRTPPQVRTIDEETGEVHLYERSGDGYRLVFDHRRVRAERWALKAAASKLLPGQRVQKCHRYRIPRQQIQVQQSKENRRAFYNGLQVCASVWACPVCASKISERRKAELQAAVSIAKAMQLRVYLVTLTFPHGLGDDLHTITDSLTKAWHGLSRGKYGIRFRQSLNLVGTVRALEVTHGANGWHPHLHALAFLDGDLTPDQVEAIFRPRWQACTVKAGLPRPSDARGCRVDGGEKAAAYIAKGSGWGIESELVKGHQKAGKHGSRTPWDMLRDYLDGDAQAGQLFKVFAKAFKGRRQLYWSNGLRDRLAIEESTDEELASRPEDDHALLLATITDDQWRAIWHNSHQALVLNLAETSPEGLRDYLKGLSHGKP